MEFVEASYIEISIGCLTVVIFAYIAYVKMYLTKFEKSIHFFKEHMQKPQNKKVENKKDAKKDTKQKAKTNDNIEKKPSEGKWIMKCQKHGYSYLVEGNKMKKIKNGDTIKDVEGVEMAYTPDCSKERGYQKKGEITKTQCIRELKDCGVRCKFH